MFLVAIIAGLVVWGIVGSTLGMLVLHKNEAGILPGLVAGIWAAWPFMHQGEFSAITSCILSQSDTRCQ